MLKPRRSMSWPLTIVATVINLCRQKATYYCFFGEYIMRTIDLSPLYRSAIGFDRLATMIESASTGNKGNNQGYPPYNIEQFSEDEYRITLAVAGFDDSELEITSHENTLLVKGIKAELQL